MKDTVQAKEIAIKLCHWMNENHVNGGIGTCAMAMVIGLAAAQTENPETALETVFAVGRKLMKDTIAKQNHGEGNA